MSDPGRCGRREIAAVSLLLLLLGAVVTWPLARHLGTDVIYAHEATPGYERVPLANGDHLQMLYLVWLLGDSVDEGRSLVRDPYQFRDGSPETFFFQPTLLPLLAWLLSPLGLVGAYGTLTLLSFVASGLSTHLLLRLGTADRLAAFAGALVAALFPYRVAQLAGHANGLLAFLVPLWIYLFERSIRGRRRLAWAAAAAVAFFFAGSMEFHIAYYLTLFAACYVPFRLLAPLDDWLEERRPSGPPPIDPRAHAAAALGGAGLGLGVCHAATRVSPVAAPAAWLLTPAVFAAVAWLAWRGALGAARRHLALSPAGSELATALPLAPLALLAAAPLGALLGVPNLGKAAVLAAAAGSLALAARALRAAGRPRLREGWRRLAAQRGGALLVHLAGIGGTLAFLVVVRAQVFSGSVAGSGRRFADVLAFSPHPADLLAPANANAERLVYLGLAALAVAAVGAVAVRRIPDPARRLPATFLGATFVLGAVLAVGAHLGEFPLYHALFGNLPMFNFPRVAARILTVASVGLAVLVAAGVAAVRAPGTGPRRFLAGWAVLLLALDYLPRHPMGLTSLPESHPVYERLTELRVPGETVLELPVWPGDSAWTALYQWWITRYRHRMVNGYSPATPADYVPRTFEPLYPLDFGEMRRPQHELLRRLGVRFVLFHEDAYPRKIGDFPFSVAAEGLRSSPFLETVAYEPPVWLFRLREDPPQGEPRIAHRSPVGSLWEGEHWAAPGVERIEDPAASGGALAFHAGGGGRASLSRATLRKAYPTGSYRVTARVLGPEGRLPGLAMTLRDERSGNSIATASRAPGVGDPGGEDLEAGFTLDEPRAVTAEIVADGSAPVAWDWLLVTFAEEPEPQTVFEVEDLWHIGRPTADPGASGGTAVRLIPGYHPRDWASEGPDRVVPAGRWSAELRYRAPDPSPGPGECFEVGIANSPGRLACEPLPPTPGEAWGTVRVPFELERSLPLRLRVRFTGSRELLLDRFTLVREGE